MWTRDEAVKVCAEFEALLIPHGYHVALGGSVLVKGFSAKDVDIFIYPHKTRETASAAVLLPNLPVSDCKKTEHSLYGDGKEVWTTNYNGKRIDFFFVQ